MSQELRAGNLRNEELVRLVVKIERLIDALEGHVDIVREGRHESAATVTEPKGRQEGSKQVAVFRFRRSDLSVPSLQMNLVSICLGDFCLSSPVV